MIEITGTLGEDVKDMLYKAYRISDVIQEKVTFEFNEVVVSVTCTKRK
jgi:hypothetical protein